MIARQTERPSRSAPVAAFVLCLGLIPPAPALATGCQEQIQGAEATFAIPSGLMLAIGHEESGLDPFAINADGVAFHPGSAAEAEATVRQLQARGARFIDVGCMQIDLHYHPDAFASLAEAFDPSTNVAYGGRLLGQLAAQHGDWPQAVANYHSGEPARQADYLGRVTARYAALKGLAPFPAAKPAAVRVPQKLSTVRLSVMTIQRPVQSGPARWWP